METIDFAYVLLQKLFSEPMAEFHITLTHMWSSDGTFEEFSIANSEMITEEDKESESI